MADADVAITAGTGTKVDTRTVGTGVDEHRQVVVVGDPATAAGVASADATNGLDVDVTRLPAVVTDGSQVAQIRSAILAVTAVGAAAAAVTNTLPAVAGQFHYITRINIQKYNTVAVVGGVTPVTVTSTNLNSVAWTFASAAAVGTLAETDLEPCSPIRSQVANTATTIVAPVTTSVLWRITVYYYTAA